MKTGSMGRPWVKRDTTTKPPAVPDLETYWIQPPPELSDRCQWWLAEIERGWRPNRRIRGEGYYSSAEWYGVYIWEWLNMIRPAVSTES